MPSSPMTPLPCFSKTALSSKPLAALAADGRGSRLREAVGINVRTWSYPQTALVMNFPIRSRTPTLRPSFTPNKARSPRFRCPASAQAWSGRSGRKKWIQSSPSRAWHSTREVETRMRSILGAVEVEGKVQAWPLSSLIADSFGKGRTMLGRRNGPCLPADRRPGSQSWPARHHAGRQHDPGCRRTAERCGSRPLLQPSTPRRCHQPDSRGRPAQPCAAEFVPAGAGACAPAVWPHCPPSRRCGCWPCAKA
jgi:hypothetical protein